MIHLDTSFLIRALVRGSVEDNSLRAWLHAGERLAMSTVSLAEFLCGPVEESDLELVNGIFGESVPFTSADAEITGRFYNLSGRRRGSLTDCMIAAVAVRSGAALATSNRADFKRLTLAGLHLAQTL